MNAATVTTKVVGRLGCLFGFHDFERLGIVTGRCRRCGKRRTTLAPGWPGLLLFLFLALSVGVFDTMRRAYRKIASALRAYREGET